MERKHTLPPGGSFAPAPVGTIDPREAARSLIALYPGHVPPPGRHQLMAENMIAAGEKCAR